MKSWRVDRMRASPVGDWNIADGEALCREHNIRCMPSSGGSSHWKVSDPTQTDILTIPQRRPIKPVYIRRLVRFVDLVKEARNAAP